MTTLTREPDDPREAAVDTYRRRRHVLGEERFPNGLPFAVLERAHDILRSAVAAEQLNQSTADNEVYLEPSEAAAMLRRARERLVEEAIRDRYVHETFHAGSYVASCESCRERRAA